MASTMGGSWSAPGKPRPDKVYQRLVDTVRDGEAIDLRTPFVGGRPVVVFIKPAAGQRPVCEPQHPRRPGASRGRVPAARDRAADGLRPCHAPGLGRARHPLRDRHTGRIYVVDVNKTDMPPLALPFHQKIVAVARLGHALRRMIQEETPQ